MPEITNPFAWMWIIFIASIFILNLYLFLKYVNQTYTGNSKN